MGLSLRHPLRRLLNGSLSHGRAGEPRRSRRRIPALLTQNSFLRGAYGAEGEVGVGGPGPDRFAPLREDDALRPVRGAVRIDGLLLDQLMPARRAYVEDGVHGLLALEM